MEAGLYLAICAALSYLVLRLVFWLLRLDIRAQVWVVCFLLIAAWVAMPALGFLYFVAR